MTPAGLLVHHIPGRTRFRIPVKRGDRAYFANLTEQLGQCPGVGAVTASEVTGSVLVLHEAADPDVLVSYARTFDLFDVPDALSGGEAIRPPAEILNLSLGHVDEWIRTHTRRGTDLRSVALTGLVGAAIWQMLRGQTLPAAATLIWYALTVASRDRQGSGGRQEGQTTSRADHAEVDPALD
jgi:hypothetical protein